jgi:hypothetical protein
MNDKVQHRTFTVHEEKRLTGAFRIRRVDGGTRMEVEAVIEKTRTMQTRETYTTFRPSTEADQELLRIRNRS